MRGFIQGRLQWGEVGRPALVHPSTPAQQRSSSVRDSPTCWPGSCAASDTNLSARRFSYSSPDLADTTGTSGVTPLIAQNIVL